MSATKRPHGILCTQTSRFNLNAQVLRNLLLWSACPCRCMQDVWEYLTQDLADAEHHSLMSHVYSPHRASKTAPSAPLPRTPLIMFSSSAAASSASRMASLLSLTAWPKAYGERTLCSVPGGSAPSAGPSATAPCGGWLDPWLRFPVGGLRDGSRADLEGGCCGPVEGPPDGSGAVSEGGWTSRVSHVGHRPLSLSAWWLMKSTTCPHSDKRVMRSVAFEVQTCGLHSCHTFKPSSSKER